MKRDLFVFDLDGTLVDSFGHYFGSLDLVFNEFGRERNARFTPELRYPALTDLLPKFLIDHLGETAAVGAMARLRELSVTDAQSIKAFEDVFPLLDHLKTRGAKIAVWTNRDFPSASAIVEHSGLKGMLDAFVSGSCVKEKKPGTEGMGKILEALGGAPGRTVMVGDHEHDVWAAKRSGVASAVRASWHEYWRVEPCTEADHQFFTVKEFAAWAERLV